MFSIHIFYLSEKTLQSKIHSSYINFTKYLKNPNIHSIFISPTNDTEVYNLITSMNNGKASEPNSIPTVILKHLNSEISVVLANLFNLSFSTDVFPNILETSIWFPTKTLNFSRSRK